MPSKHRPTRCLILSVIGLYLLDQVTKWVIVLNFIPPDDLHAGYVLDRVPVISGSSIMNFDLVRLHNNGVAFGMGNGTEWAPFLFLGVQIVALILLWVLYRRGFFFNKLLQWAWAFITAGVLGNMTDRLTQGFFLPGAEQLSFFENLINGYVVDFLDFSFPWITKLYVPDFSLPFPWLAELEFPWGYHWPSFNVADSCVCIAAGLFLISAFLPHPKAKDAEDKPVTETKA